MLKPLAIITGDWHIHKWKQFNQFNQRLNSNSHLFKFFGEKAGELKVPILFTGDLFENPKTLPNIVITKSLRAYKEHIHRAGHKFAAISGNHDQEEPNTLYNQSSSYLQAFDDVFSSFTLLDNSIFKAPNIEVHGIPFLTGNVGLKETIKKINKIPKEQKYKILNIHTDLHGALSTDGRVVDSVEGIPENMGQFFRGFDLVISGHIHKPQIIIDNKIYMIGAPQQQNRGDKDCQMGYWILYETSLGLKMKFFKTDYPKFIEIPEYEYSKLSQAEKGLNYYIRIPEVEISKDATGFTEFSSKAQRSKIVRRWAKATGEKSKRKLKTLKSILNKVY